MTALKQEVATLDIYVLFSRSTNCIDKISEINKKIKEIKQAGITEKLYSEYLQNVK